MNSFGRTGKGSKNGEEDQAARPGWKFGWQEWFYGIAPKTSQTVTWTPRKLRRPKGGNGKSSSRWFPVCVLYPFLNSNNYF